MKQQAEIEIYVAECAMAQVVGWIESRLGPLQGPDVVGDADVYESSCGSVIVTEVEGGPFVSLWFNRLGTPWVTDIDCARDAARALHCRVRCDPGEHYPDVPPQSSIFLEFLGESERLITWE